MIDKNKGKYLVVCDICSEEPKEFNYFHGAIDYMKSEGWLAKKTQDGWEHICPDCKECE